MEEWIIPIIAVAVILYILIEVLSAVRIKNAKKCIYDFIANKGVNVSWGSKKNCYDYVITNKDNKYYVKLSVIPANSCVTINYKDTFVLRYGGTKDQIGRSYPKERYMNELVAFLNSSYNGQKIVLFYPSTERVLKYLNESDIGIVNYTDTPYDMKVMNTDDFKNHFEEIIK